MDEWKAEGERVSGAGGGGEVEGGAGLWIGSTALTGPDWAGETSAAPPCRRHSRTKQGETSTQEEKPS